MQPIGKYIAVVDLNEETKTKSGLILSGEDMQQMRYRRARVLKPGTDVVSMKVDDVVYYDKAQSFTMVVKEETVTIIREGDVVIVE